jgi:leucyl aminopeptidase
MPVNGTVIAAISENFETAGHFLQAVAAGEVSAPDLVVLAVGAGGEVEADDALDGVLPAAAHELVSAARLAGKAGQIGQVVARAGEHAVRVAFLGVGDRSAAALRRAGGELGRMLKPGEVAVASVVAGRGSEEARAFAEGALLGLYRYSLKSSADEDRAEGPQVRLLGGSESAGSGQAGAETSLASAVAEAEIFASAVALARDLANTPSLTKYPQWLADVATDIGADAGLSVRVWSEHELAAGGFGGILAVGAGSQRPPRLIELQYAPAGADRHVVLVGKGITFDSGGLSLKPNDGMKAMKTDMAGGAVVIAVMSALARLGVRAKVTGLVAAAENMPSGSAYRPGDVLSAYGGRTVEVLNTDAEGRLVLGDALAYAETALAPDQVIDIATLTGAARIALGGSRAALYSTSDELAADLAEAGEASGDRLWHMPLVDEYRALLDSPVADLANVPRSDGGAGSIVAALFLREFAGSAPWAHLDIAGAARCGADDGEFTAGATGFGTRLLLRWLQGVRPGA